MTPGLGRYEMPHFSFRTNSRSLPGLSILGLALVGVLATTACSGDDGGKPDASGGVASSSGGTEGATGGTDGSSGGSDSSGGSEMGTGGELGETGAGTPCVDDAECPEKIGSVVAFCGDNWPGGYCTATCSTVGSNQCGEGAICDILGIGWCLKSCNDDSDCRDGYYCADDTKGCEKDF